MRNKYPGKCYHCGKEVAPGAGHFERSHGGWETIHATCVFDIRRKKYSIMNFEAEIQADFDRIDEEIRLNDMGD